MSDLTTVNQNNQVAIIPDVDWTSGFKDTSDFVIPHLSLTQASSQIVKEGKVNMGQIIETTDHRVICDRNKSVQVIPIKAKVEYVHTIKNGEKFDYIQKLDFVAGFPSGKWKHEVMVEGVLNRYTKQLVMHVLLASELESIPHILTMKGMSVFTAKKMLSYFMLCDAERKPCAKHVFELKAELKEFNGNSSFAYEMVKSGNASDEQFAKALEWRRVLTGSTIKEAEATTEGDEIPF